MLMTMSHKGKGPEAYDNRKLVDLMEGTGIIQSTSPIIILREAMEGEHHMDRQVAGLLLDHTCPHSQMSPHNLNHIDDFVELFEQYSREYNSLNLTVQRQMTLDQYCQIKFRNKPRPHHRSNYEFERRAGKMEIPYFDGSAKMTAQAWVQKLDTYLQLNPMREMEAIKFATMYLDGKAHDWWYHGLTTLGHNQIVAYT
jgi:hypothetical protein